MSQRKEKLLRKQMKKNGISEPAPDKIVTNKEFLDALSEYFKRYRGYPYISVSKVGTLTTDEKSPDYMRGILTMHKELPVLEDSGIYTSYEQIKIHTIPIYNKDFVGLVLDKTGLVYHGDPFKNLGIPVFMETAINPPTETVDLTKANAEPV